MTELIVRLDHRSDCTKALTKWCQKNKRVKKSPYLRANFYSTYTKLTFVDDATAVEFKLLDLGGEVLSVERPDLAWSWVEMMHAVHQGSAIECMKLNAQVGVKHRYVHPWEMPRKIKGQMALLAHERATGE